MSEKIKVHYVAGTHWDREWYLPFQGFRYRLVKLFDGLLELMESDPSYAHFFFDGQTVAVEDYLEIRPEQRDKIVRFLKNGRLLIGPWYAMPDERLLSGEALIRNLLKGCTIARSLGAEPMRYGYICDIFGHIAQMPQIFRGFAIDQALLGRGTNAHTHPAFFEWYAPNNDSLRVFRLPDAPGYGMAHRFYEAAEKGDSESTEWAEEVARQARSLFESEKVRCPGSLQLWLDALDHQTPGRNIPKALEVAARELEGEAEIVFSTLPDFAAEVAAMPEDKVPPRAGELIQPTREEGGYCHLISHCLSSHYPMKRANDLCQTALENWVEPLYAKAVRDGRAPARGFLDLAWEYLLKNHAHDSICGCSVDQVHKDTEYRYDQARLLAENLFDDLLKVQVEEGASEGGPEDIFLSVVNAIPLPHRRVVEAEIVWPAANSRHKMVGFAGRPAPCFELFDEAGERIDYQLLSDAGESKPGMAASPAYRFSDGEKVRFSFIGDFDGIGLKHFHLRNSPKPVRCLESMLIAPLTARNRYFEVEIAADGSLIILDLASGQRYEKLLQFEDSGETGDGWYHVPPIANQVFHSTACHADISVRQQGPLLVTFVVEKTMCLPREMEWSAMRRSPHRETLKITTEITLRQDARQVECKVLVDNQLRDHRLRALFPTEVEGDDYFSAQPFAMLKRSRGIDRQTADWKECDTEERDFLGVVGLADGKRGLALLGGSGLHEAAVRDDRAGTLALTLFRAFKTTVGTTGETRGQLLHPMEFDFALAPFSGEPESSSLLWRAMSLQCPPKFVQSRGLRPLKQSPFMVFENGTACLSALKPAAGGDGTILRLFNPDIENRVNERIVFDRAFARIYPATLEEKVCRDQVLAQDSATVEMSLEPGEIMTTMIEWDES